jgi:flagella basal body P-ring formation protein FlgA
VQVVARPIGRGRPITRDDVRIDRVDPTRSTLPLIGVDESVEDLVAVRSIAAAEPLRRDLVKPTSILAAGDPVRVL